MHPILLIVDSNPTEQQHAREFFEENGFRVETACSGLDCLGALRCFTPHAIIMETDVCWGNADGVLDNIRHNARLRDVPVILVGPVDDKLQASKRYPNAISDSVVARLEQPLDLNAALDVLMAEMPEFATDRFLARVDRILEQYFALDKTASTSPGLSGNRADLF